MPSSPFDPVVDALPQGAWLKWSDPASDVTTWSLNYRDRDGISQVADYSVPANEIALHLGTVEFTHALHRHLVFLEERIVQAGGTFEVRG